MGDFAMMTDEGTFIVNGTERVVVSQLVRSPGVYFTAAEDPNTGRKLFGAKLIPNRGAWLEIETSAKDLLTVKIDRKRKVPVTVLLKALELPQLKGTENDREAQKRALMEMFGDVDNNPDHRYMESTLDKDTTNKTEDALLELYRRVRPGDPRPSTTRATCCRACSSTRAGSTSAVSDGTRSTSGSAAMRRTSSRACASVSCGFWRRVTSSPSFAS